MTKLLKYSKLLFFIIVLLIFVDILFNPKIQYLNGNYETIINYKYYFIYGVLTTTMLSIITIEFKQNIFPNSVKYFLRIIYVLFSLYFINSFFLFMSFNQLTDYIVSILLVMPTVLVIEKLLKKIKLNRLFVFITGLAIIFFDLFYFTVIYSPYEDYLFGLPIMYIHYAFRNWILILGLTMVLISTIRYLEKNER